MRPSATIDLNKAIKKKEETLVINAPAYITTVLKTHATDSVYHIINGYAMNETAILGGEKKTR
jgi:hypothetical protein